MLSRHSIRLRTSISCFNQKRNAVVLKRVYKVPRLPESATQEEIDKRVLTTCFSHMRYHVVEETDAEPGIVKVLLLKSSEEFGRRGQIRAIKARIARQELLLPGYGVYASPYNLQKYKDIVLPEDSVQSSSESATKSVADLTTCVVPVVMSGNFKWKLEPWHVKFGLISQGIFTDEESIQIPETQISGPNPTLEGKEFLVTVKINDFETVNIRAILFHKSIEDLGIEKPGDGWEKRFYSPVFPEEVETLRLLPRQKITKEDVAHLRDGQKNHGRICRLERRKR